MEQEPDNILYHDHDEDGDGNFQLKPLEWTIYETCLSIILGCIIILTIFGNGTVLLDFFQRAKASLHRTTPTHFFIANLALADFLVGVLVLPFLAVLQVTERWYFSQSLCIAWNCTHFWLCAASILSTTAVCTERYIGVKYPVLHMRILNTNRILWSLIAVWVLAGIPSIVRVFAWTQPRIDVAYHCDPNQKLGHSILAAVGIFYIPATIMTILYWRIYRIAARHMDIQRQGLVVKEAGGASRKLSVSVGGSTYNSSTSVKSTDHDGVSTSVGQDQKEPSKTNSHSSEKSAKKNPSPKSPESIAKRQINLAKKLAVLVGLVLFSYGPYFTLILVRAIDKHAVSDEIFNVFAWIRYFNSCINPLIYAYAVPAYRKAFRKRFGEICFWKK